MSTIFYEVGGWRGTKICYLITVDKSLTGLFLAVIVFKLVCDNSLSQEK